MMESKNGEEEREDRERQHRKEMKKVGRRKEDTRAYRSTGKEWRENHYIMVSHIQPCIVPVPSGIHDIVLSSV